MITMINGWTCDEFGIHQDVGEYYCHLELDGFVWKLKIHKKSLFISEFSFANNPEQENSLMYATLYCNKFIKWFFVLGKLYG